MNIRYDNGLLFIDIKISYLGKSKLIKNVVIDTGASHTIISPDIVSSIGISASPLDKFITMYGIGGEHYAYRKKIDSVSICGMDLKDIEIDFGVIDENGNINIEFLTNEDNQGMMSSGSYNVIEENNKKIWLEGSSKQQEELPPL